MRLPTRPVLELVLLDTPLDSPPIVLADTPGSGSDVASRALIAGAVSCRRRVLAPPRDVPPLALRHWHRDAWRAMPGSERRRVALVVGPSAQYLAPFIDPEPELNALVEDPVAAMLAIGVKPRWLRSDDGTDDRLARRRTRIARLVNAQSRALLQPWHDDTFGLSEGPPPDAGIWRELLFDDVLTRVHAYPAEEAAPLVQGIAKRLGWAAKPVGRLAATMAAGTSRRAGPDQVETLREAGWLDDELRARCLAVSTSGGS